MSNILVVGSLNMDLVNYVTHLPQPGETISSMKYFENTGGKGANQAVAAAKLGANVQMIGKVGLDNYGLKLVESLLDNNVRTEGIVKEGITGKAFITVSKEGENHIVIDPGANNKITEHEIDEKIDMIKNCDLIIMQLEIPLSIVKYVLQIASCMNKRVILNPAPGMDLPTDLFQVIDTLILNETELAILTGMAVSVEREIINAGQKLKSFGVNRVVITLGEKGAVVINDKEQFKIPAYEVQTIDTTGAGDAYIGAFAVAILSGKSDREAAVFASKVAAITVTREGAQQSLPNLDEVKNFEFKGT